MNNRMKILKEVGVVADKFRNDAEKMGDLAKKAFPDEKNRSQMKHLENIANSALKVSDVLDYIKRQTGRSKPHEKWKVGNFGSDLLDHIQRRKGDTEDISDELDISDEIDRLEVNLLLIREFVKQVVIHYEYNPGAKDE